MACVACHGLMVAGPPDLFTLLFSLFLPTRGLCYFQIQVTCATSDLHSGVYGGTLIEAMPDVTHLLNSLVDDDGCITIPDFNDDVDDLRAEEARMYENIDFSRNAYREELGVGVLPHEDKKETLMHRWRCPSLSIHGIHGDYCGPGEKAVIPGRVTGKFSVRTVPYQKSQKVCECVTRHVEREFARRNSPNKLKITASTCSEPWIVDPRSAHFRSAASAVKHVYGTKPDLIRSGGSVAAAAALRDHVTANVIQMPISASDGYSENEYIPIEDLVRGAKLFAAYCYEIAKMQ
ncbi:hypothetical protein V5799_015387 [Amblyomma americanum]|uniref:Peptidase M20 dimerisation domain-containing protein n=1 Tax=Amblyomma americanum TaxID=6943 RepID=A0AAQ4F9C0_AMBAM